MTTSDDWTPYGLEAIRGRVLWRRRIVALVFLILAAVAILALLALFTTEEVVETRISLTGGEGSDTIAVETRDANDLRTKPLTVALSPGGITLVGNGLEGGQPPDQLSRASINYPFIRGERPIQWMGLFFPWGLLALLAWGLYAAGRGASNPSSEVNFGIYKGAMPLEMMTASYRHLVRTQRLAGGSIFGKEREDHVPTARIRRV